jgi:glutamate N-acetyltransferase/amino-acid N-acetyltransferase
MAVNLPKLTTLSAINGIKIATTCAEIRQNQRDDLAIFALDENSICAAVFTQNAFCAAPVELSREHLAKNNPRYLIINSGNANAGTGIQGNKDALTCCQAISPNNPTEVLVFSTGVIGETLPMDKILSAIPTAIQNLHANNWINAAKAIMTTDTMPKGFSEQVIINNEKITITGIAKGVGMIMPNMATLLAFIATDAKISNSLLQKILNQAVNLSFNRITVDGDTSTNDSCVLIATGKSNVEITEENIDDFNLFQQAINKVFLKLAQALVRDGEGATKFITLDINEGENEQECLSIAYTIAHSPLVKTAFFASDANWGRILAALGRAEVDNLDINKVKIYLDNVCIVRDGGCATTYTDAQGQTVMQNKEITVRILLGRGNYKAKIYTCDFSYDYVKINAEYRT